MPRSKGRAGRPWRRLRASVLAASDVCWICGHPGSQDVDHVIPLSRHGQPRERANLRPAHGVKGCPYCGHKCNQERGNRLGTPRRHTQSRAW